MNHKISAYDVAKLANVSQSTVSRVLNDHRNVKQETRVKVHKAIKEIGFTPSDIARSLASNKTNTIGLIVEDISNSFYAETAHIILKEAQKYNYEVIIAESEADEESFSQAILTLNSKRVDGIIVASIRMDNKKLKEHHKNGVPIICYNRRSYSAPNSHYVEVDNQQGAIEGVNYLANLKHSKIAYVSGPIVYSTFYERLEGFEKARKINGLKYSKSLILKENLDMDQVYRFTLDLLNSENSPTAFFASTDQIALVIMDAIAKCGRNIPDDISVMGFDDITISSNNYINLTTISQRKEEMATAAIKELVKIIKEDQKSYYHRAIVLKPLLIERSTTDISKSLT